MLRPPPGGAPMPHAVPQRPQGVGHMHVGPDGLPHKAEFWPHGGSEADEDYGAYSSPGAAAWGAKPQAGYWRGRPLPLPSLPALPLPLPLQGPGPGQPRMGRPNLAHGLGGVRPVVNGVACTGPVYGMHMPMPMQMPVPVAIPFPPVPQQPLPTKTRRVSRQHPRGGGGGGWGGLGPLPALPRPALPLRPAAHALCGCPPDRPRAPRIRSAAAAAARRRCAATTRRWWRRSMRCGSG
jgi:hypothetical protein